MTAILTGCSGAKLKTEWREQRGYSDADSQLAMNQMDEYNKRLIMANQASSRFDSAPMTNEQNRLRTVFCACVKKIGDKCREKPDGLTGADKTLWVKANAVDMAFVASHSAIDPGPAYKIDTSECQ